MSATEMPHPLDWTIKAAAEITDLLFYAVRRNKGDACAADCFAPIPLVDIAKIIARHAAPPEPMVEISSGIVPAGPIKRSDERLEGLRRPPPVPATPARPEDWRVRPFVMEQNAVSIVPKIKHILISRKQRVSQLAATLHLPESDIELAINQPGSGLVIGKAGWVSEIKE